MRRTQVKKSFLHGITVSDTNITALIQQVSTMKKMLMTNMKKHRLQNGAALYM